MISFSELYLRVVLQKNYMKGFWNLFHFLIKKIIKSFVNCLDLILSFIIKKKILTNTSNYSNFIILNNKLRNKKGIICNIYICFTINHLNYFSYL